MPVQLSKELVLLIEGGVSIQVGTRDAELHPECLRAVGAAVAADRTSVTLYLPAELAERTLENLAQNAQVAASFSHVCDHRTVQVKGKLKSLRGGTNEDRPLQEQYLAAFAEQMHSVGCSRSLLRRLRHWPSVALEIEVLEVFAQTPGPGAGQRIEPGT